MLSIKDLPQTIPDILTISDAIELLKISRSTFIKDINSKKINYIRIGRQYRFTKNDIVDYLNQCYSKEEG